MNFKPSFVQMVSVPIKGRVEVLSMAEVQELMQNLGELLTASQPQSNQIKLKVCHEFGLRMDEMMSNRRTSRIVFPRQVAMWLHRVMTPMSLMEISRAFAYPNGTSRDHGTIAHACNLVERTRSNDKKLRAKIDAIQNDLEKSEKVLAEAKAV